MAIQSQRASQMCLLCMSIMLMACANDGPSTPEPPATYDATPYQLDLKGIPVPPFIPADNPLTVQGVKLGSMLFKERMLSRGSAQSCADCHAQSAGFSDTRRYSIGVDGMAGRRQAMPLINLAFVPVSGPGGPGRGFFWDGRSPTLRDQALQPIQDPVEMHETLPNVIAKLQSSSTYRNQFMRAFGSDTITADRIARALEQFALSLVSFDSKFDRVQRGQATFTAQEQRGRDLFFSEMSHDGSVRGAECFHCHGGPSFSNFNFSNNGLDDEPTVSDVGRMEVTNNPRDRGKFKTPTLRNIAVTPPYMHDGRFTSLRQTIEHYNTGIKISPTLDPALDLNRRPGGLGLREDEIQDLEAFLYTLTDTTFITKPH